MKTRKFTRQRRVLTLALGMTLALVATQSSAQSAVDSGWPKRPITLLVGAPAGGSADIIARVLGESISKQLGQPVIVENKPGAMSTLAARSLVTAPHDGYTYVVSAELLVTEIPHSIKTAYDPFKDIAPLAEIAHGTLVLVGNPKLPAQTLKELAAYLKTQPGKMSFASYSSGTISHTLGLQLNTLAGLDMVHVGYKGSPPALQDVMGGQAQLMFDGMPTSLPLIKSGKLKAFAVTGSRRALALPDLPTVAEAGFPALETNPWFALWTVPDAPAAAQTRMREAVLAAIKQPAIAQRLNTLGLETKATPATPEQMQQTLQASYNRVGDVLRTINYKPE